MYKVNATATDNASNVGSADSNSFTFDTGDPTGVITDPTNNAYKDETFVNITGTASESISSVASVIISIYNTTDGAYWTGTLWQAGVATISVNGTTSWYYSDASTFPTFSNGNSYIVNLTVNDSAGNSNTAADSNTFLYDTGGPTISVSYTHLRAHET